MDQLDYSEESKMLSKDSYLFESMLPDTIALTDEQLKTFLEKTAANEHGRRILDGLTIDIYNLFLLPGWVSTAPAVVFIALIFLPSIYRNPTLLRFLY